MSAAQPPVGGLTGSGWPLPQSLPSIQATSSGRKMSSFCHSALSSIQRRQPSSGMSVPFSGYGSSAGFAFVGSASEGVTAAAVVRAAEVCRKARREMLSDMFSASLARARRQKQIPCGDDNRKAKARRQIRRSFDSAYGSLRMKAVGDC